MVKKAQLEDIKELDWLCGQAKHLKELYKEKAKQFPKDDAERMFFDMVSRNYESIATGACGLFDIAATVAKTEFLPREMLIKNYKEFVKEQSSTV